MTEAQVNRSLADGERSVADDVVDVVAALALTWIGLYGLQDVFGGLGYLLIGVVGSLLGAGVVWLLAWRTASPLAWVLGLAGAFVIGSGVAVPDDSLFGVVPTPASVLGVLGAMGSSWVDLVTTSPPTGTADGLAVVPYVLGFAGAAAGVAAARLTRLSLFPASPGALVVIASILLGTSEPVSVVLQGGAFTAIALGWGSVRANRARRSSDRQVHWTRAISGVAMLVIVVAISFPLAAALPLVETNDRYVVREETEPPFDPRREPSPLADFRSYLKEEVKEEPVLAVEGLPKGARIRLATMDTYDGVVWIVGGPEAAGSGRFERVGSSIQPTPPGEDAVVTIRSEVDRDDVWLPTVGYTEVLEAKGDGGSAIVDNFRYNRATGTAALPSRLHAGDTYVLRASVAREPDREQLRSVPADTSVDLPTITHASETVTETSAEWTSGIERPFEQAEALEKQLQAGYFSDGDEGNGTSPAGHSLARLDSMLGENGDLVGNEEQYAAAMALLARSAGLPARVVMGFHPEDGGDHVFRHEDVTAWVEIAFDGVGWVPFDPTPPEDRTWEEQPRSQPESASYEQAQPPPPTYLEPPDPIPPEASPPPEEAPEEAGVLGFSLPAWLVTLLKVVLYPALLIGAVVGTIVGLKALIRRRRRTRGTPVERVAGAWREMCDRVVDRGAHLPRRSTRRELALAVGPSTWGRAESFAGRIDAAMFGPADPDEATAAEIWTAVDDERRALLDGLDWKARLKATLNLRSFWSRP